MKLFVCVVLSHLLVFQTTYANAFSCYLCEGSSCKDPKVSVCPVGGWCFLITYPNGYVTKGCGGAPPKERLHNVPGCYNVDEDEICMCTTNLCNKHKPTPESIEKEKKFQDEKKELALTAVDPPSATTAKQLALSTVVGGVLLHRL